MAVLWLEGNHFKVMYILSVISYKDMAKVAQAEVLLLMLRCSPLPEKNPLDCDIFYW